MIISDLESSKIIDDIWKQKTIADQQFRRKYRKSIHCQNEYSIEKEFSKHNEM